MNNIQLNIVANAQFQQVYAEVAKLKEAMLTLQKASVGGPFTPTNVSNIKAAQQAFDNAVLSTRAFNIESVAMSSNVEKFGKSLAAGKLSLSQYYKIWRDSAKGVSAELDTLAISQARLNRSIAIADPLRPGYAKLVTDINGVVTAQEKQIFYQRALNTALQEGSIKLINFGKNTQWMGRQLTVGLSMPLAMFGAGVSQAFLTVDKELTRMQKVYGTGLVQPTQQALKQIRSDVQALGTELAKTLGTSVKDTASMAADLAATGLEGSKLIGATREAIRLATLGELDHQQAMQATISLQNVYKLSTQGLSDAVNFLNAVENQTSTSLQDLVDAIPRVGPIVQQLGGSFKDTAAMMVAMKEAGVPAAQGANAIKSALSSLINPTKSAQNAFAAFNINIAGIAKATNGNPIQMLKMLSDQMKNLDRLSQAQLIEKLFGKFQYARIQALLDNINKAGSQTATVFNLMGASTTDLAKLAANELKQQTESASGKFKRMTETLKADFLPIGNMFLNAFTKIGMVVDKIISSFRSLSNVLGPVGKLLGPLLGGGLAGLVIVGPIIMMAGLFANLIGNIMRGANALRMFKQGLDSAAPSENKFMAGLHGMQNFYQDLDKSTIAARNQMELMPEAITSNAKAFDILSKSIADITAQFEAFAIAQREAMGMGSGGTIMPAPFNIPFRAPGHAGGIIGINGPGTSTSDSIPAMISKGESVMTAAATAKYGTVLSAMNNGTLPGFMSGYTPARSHAALPFAEDSWQFGAGIKMAGLESIYSSFPQFIKVVSNLVAELPQSLNVALVRGKASIEQFTSAWAGRSGKFLLSAKMGGANIEDPKMQAAVAKLEQEIGQRTVALAKGTENQTVSDELLAQATNDVITKYKSLSTAEGQAATALYEASQQIGQVRTQFSTEALRAGIASGQFALSGNNVSYNGMNIARTRGSLTQEGQLAFRPASSWNASGNYTRQALQGEQIAAEAAQVTEQMMMQVVAGVQKGIRNAAQMHSPAQEEIVMGETLVDSLNVGAESRKGQSTIVGEQIGDSVNTGIKSRLAKITNSVSNMGMAGRMGLGTGLMMGGSMLGGAIGGTVGSTISSSSMFGSMASMFTQSPQVMMGMAALGAAIPVLTGVIKKASDDIRIQGNTLKGTLSLSSTSVDYFHLKFTPLAQYDFAGIADGLGKHVKSIKENKAAVDTLTAAYLSASDQMTKDYLSGLKKQSPGELQSSIKSKYASNIASGMTAQQSLQDITSIMNAVGVSGINQMGIRSKLDTNLTSGQAMAQILNDANSIKPQRVSIGGKAGGIAAYQASQEAAKKQAEGINTILVNMAGVNSKTFADLYKNLDGTSKKIINTDKAYEKFASTVSGGNKDIITFSKAFRTAGGTTDQFSAAIRLYNAHILKTSELLALLKDKSGKTFDKTFLDNLGKLTAFESAASGDSSSSGSLGGAGGTAPDYSKQYAPLIKHLTDVRKLINAQAEAQKKYNDQLKATQDYNIKQLDYFNQMKNAFTSGNFLGAAQIKQSAQASQADFAAQVQQQKQQDALANIDNILATVQEASTGGKSLAAWSKANPGLARFATSKYDSSLLGGLTAANYSKQTSGIVSKANAAQGAAAAASSGGPFQNLVINVSADNSVIPDQFGKNLAAQIQSAVQKAYAKTHTSNHVGNNTTTRGVKVK